MISSNSKKCLLLLSFALMLCSASCRFWQDTSDSTDSQKTSDSIIETNIPFSTSEPENFKATITITNFINGEKNERKIINAKLGDKSLQTFNAETQNARSILHSEDKIYLINHNSKSYREISGDQVDAFANDKLIETLTSKWLNEKKSAKFEKLESENNLTKYRINIDDSNSSEIFIYIDEKLKMPVKQEFYSIRDDKKTLNYSVEIKDIKLEVENNLFALPTDYKKIS